MISEERDVSEIVDVVLAKKKYRNISIDLVRMLAQMELSKERRKKEAIKEVSSRLHQIAAGYFKSTPRYQEWIEEFESLPKDVNHEQARIFCKKIMQKHNSTAERLPIIKDFFFQTLEDIKPLKSIMDLGCGFNPLAVGWMPVSRNTEYFGWDIFTDLINFLDVFYKKFNLKGKFEVCNLLELIKRPPLAKEAQVTLLLKTIPCLTQLEKNAGLKLLENIPSPFILVSYPVASLGGRQKGMPINYETQFWQLVDSKNWQIKSFHFQTEKAFLIKK